MNSQLDFSQFESSQEKCRQMRSEKIYGSFISLFNGLRLKIAKRIAPKDVVISRVDNEIVRASTHGAISPTLSLSGRSGSAI